MGYWPIMRDLGKTLQGLVHCIKLKGQKRAIIPRWIMPENQAERRCLCDTGGL